MCKVKWEDLAMEEKEIWDEDWITYKKRELTVEE